MRSNHRRSQRNPPRKRVTPPARPLQHPRADGRRPRRHAQRVGSGQRPRSRQPGGPQRGRGRKRLHQLGEIPQRPMPVRRLLMLISIGKNTEVQNAMQLTMYFYWIMCWCSAELKYAKHVNLGRFQYAFRTMRIPRLILDPFGL